MRARRHPGNVEFQNWGISDFSLACANPVLTRQPPRAGYELQPQCEGVEVSEHAQRRYHLGTARYAKETLALYVKRHPLFDVAPSLIFSERRKELFLLTAVTVIMQFH